MSTLAQRNGTTYARREHEAARPVATYAWFGGAFALVAGALTAAAARRNPERLDLTDLSQLSLATYLVSRVVAREKVGAPLREPFVQSDPRADPEDVRGDAMIASGDGLRKATGELILCTRCVGVWSAAGLSFARLLAPGPMRVLLPALAAGGANSLLQAIHARITEPPGQK